MKFPVVLFLLFLNILSSKGSSPVNDSGTANTIDREFKRGFDKNMSKSGGFRKSNFSDLGEIEILRRLLDAPPEKLKIMKKTIERVESMTPEQKRNVSNRLKKLRESPPHIRHNEIGKLRFRRDKLNNYWQGLGVEERKSEMEKFFKLSALGREKYMTEITSKN